MLKMQFIYLSNAEKAKKIKLLNLKPFKFQVRFAIPEVYGYKYAYY